MSILSEFELSGRVALVTGGARGLGVEACRALASAGAHVVVAARDEARAERVATEIRSVGLSAEPLLLDVLDASNVEGAMEGLYKSHGRVDVLVNMAGVAHERKAVETTDQDWDHVVRTNLDGSFATIRAFIRYPSVVERSIINVASLAAHVGVRRQAAYSASKGAVVSLSRSLAVELAPEGIRVNVLSPGYFNTDMPGAVMDDPGLLESLLKKIPVRRVAEPEEIGAPLVFLASNASRYMTGAVLTFDGGFTAQ